ncbi:MAG: SDR family NAD(P)-dependent oxidoreductase, partial [Acidobacteria bacterium]|nr:SDR family NAD(P)-dependent oxidoreductase [Acidobacteriota bacterium]
NEAAVMNPQARIFHECVWEALEQAGYDPGTYTGKIGLYAGASSSTAWESLVTWSGKADEVGRFAAVSLADSNFLCTRIAYKFNLRGPVYAIQSACSTSLTAIDLACRSILTGMCNMALAGGVSLKDIRKTRGYLFKEGMIRSPDGHCRAFDAEAKGIAGGEGAGVVLLKLLDEALTDGDNIHAIVKGSASNNDGSRKVGYTAPSIEGQAEVIRAAHLAAEIDPETVTYVETHGTGTSLGDPVEIEALKQGFGTNKKGFCFIGSVKTNIGHLDTAAGVTGFIKTVLALEHRLIPPSLNFKTPNPKIDFENSPFCINTILKEWPRGNFPLRAGVSAFGIGGTNAHVVLEEWPQNTPRTEKTAKPTQSAYYLIPLSARTGTALDKMSANLCAFLQEHKEYIDPGDVAYTLQVGRKRFHQRRILICSGIAEAIKEFSSTTSNKTLSFNAFEKAPAVIFMFPGQGSQYVGMALDLYRSEPIFRQEMDRCFAILKSLMDYDLKEILYPSLKNNPITGDLLINETEITQPVIFTIEYALTKLLMTWGIKPYAMIGHSIGEYTAACIAGVFSLENALKIVTMRGKLMQQVPHGAMTGVAISEKQLLPLLEAYPNIALAAVNSPANCTVSGAQQDIAVFEEQAKENGFRIRPLHTSHAFHSRMMDPILETFAGTFKHVQVNKPVIPYLSNLSGTWISTEQIQDPTYWSKHLRQAVRFSDGLQELLKIENTIFIEVGPGRVLSTFVKEHETGKNGKTAPQVINLVKHPQEEIPGLYFLYREIGKLWLYGKELDWQAFRREEQGRRIPLPAYPFERQHFHIERNAQLVSNMAGGAADRFYLPRWKRTPPVYKNKTDNISENKKNQWLVFMDKVGFGAALVKHLENRGDEVITVMAGETIQPQNPEDYLKFFKSLNREGRLPDRVIHLWTLSGPDRLAVEDLLDLGFYSLLNIAKAIRKNSQHSPGSGQQFRLYVISDHWWDVTGEEIIEPAKAVMAGPLAVIPQEHPNIRCRAIDIVYRGQQEHHLVERITAEMLNDRGEAAAAFRGPYRLTRDFEPLHLDAVKPGQLPLQEKGIYLITGGLGKIGFNLASWLAKDYQARLILTGRSGGGHDAETIKKIKELESLGAEVMVCQADVRDRRQMQNITAAAQERWGEIQGVIHAAGILKGKSFNTVENLQPADCLQQFQAKVYGTQVLEELLADKKLDFCLLISSISTILGGLQFAAYAGANAFMDAFASQQKRDNHFYWLSVAWDHMPARETIEAFKRILALPISEINSVAVSGTGNLQARIDRWINLEFTGEDNKTASEDTNGLNAQSQHPRPQLCTPFAAPAGKTQEALAQTWKRLFGFDQIGIHDDFLELGGDSLKAVTVIAAIHKALNVEVPLPVFFSNPTIEKLAEYIDNTKNVHKTSYHAVTPVEKKEYYSLSSAQERLYFLQQLDLKSVSYHMPFVYPLPKEINKEKLELTLKHLIARHESLRTSFIVVHEEVVQRIHQNVDFAIEYYDLTAEETKVFGSPPLRPPEAFIRPFDLSRAPLIRSGIMKLPGDRWLWLLDMHHIISDGTSHSILTEDFSALYEDLVLEPLLLQYKDYAQWQNNMLKSGKINAQEEYWIKLFAGEIPRLKMPADNKRPAVFTFAGDRFGFYLSPENSADFKALGAVNGGTLYMNLLAAVNTLFFKYTGQTDIIIGCGIAGRPHADLQRIVGMFINTLAMRNYPGGEKTYQLFLKEVIAQSIEAFENQDVPFEELVARLALDRDPSCNPLFDITMVLQNFRQTKVVTTNAEVVPDQGAFDPNVETAVTAVLCMERLQLVDVARDQIGQVDRDRSAVPADRLKDGFQVVVVGRAAVVRAVPAAVDVRRGERQAGRAARFAGGEIGRLHRSGCGAAEVDGVGEGTLQVQALAEVASEEGTGRGGQRGDRAGKGVATAEVHQRIGAARTDRRQAQRLGPD